MKRYLAVLAAITGLLLGATTVMSSDFEYLPVEDAFQSTWERSDSPVSEGQVQRTWLWGPGGYSGALDEQYADSPDGIRLVQYFDKSRMELTDPEAESEDTWSVTQGLLARELVTGYLQLGDELFEQHLPADIPVAGDPDDTTGPTYATFSEAVFETSTPDNGSEIVVQTIDRSGNIGTDDSYAQYGVTRDFYVAETSHHIASVFWEVINAEGLVLIDDELVEDQLFPERFYGMGYPITEPYWTEASVQGEENSVLVQCFERRCLTFTPSNEPEWQVEAGNVGQHYYQWRYSEIDRDAPITPPAPELPVDPVAPVDPEASVPPPSGELLVQNPPQTIGDRDDVIARVVDADGEPISDAVVDLEIVLGSDVVSLDENTIVTNDVGEASAGITADAPGTAVVGGEATIDDEVIDLGQAVIVIPPVTDVDVELNIETDTDALQPESGGTVVVVVTNGNGDPIAELELDVEIISGDEYVTVPDETVVTDSDGRAEIEVIGESPGNSVIEVGAEVDGEEVVGAVPVEVEDIFTVDASVSNASPATRSNVTILATIERNGTPVQGADMTATWFFRTVTSACTGQSDGAGAARCSRQIGAATPGYTVQVRVTFTYDGETFTAWTSFTPV